VGRRTLWIAAALLVALSSACGGGGRAGARQFSRTESRIYTIAQVKAAFRQQHLALRYRGTWWLDGLPRVRHAVPLNYYRSAKVSLTPTGHLRGSSWAWSFEVVAFRTPSAAASAFTPRLTSFLRKIHEPWSRRGNIALVATQSVVVANHDLKHWQRAVSVLRALGH
jgi:hypothetical protein